jgi:hypothetical protein
MSDLGFNNDEVEFFFMDKTKSENVTFDDLGYFFSRIALLKWMNMLV